jgi:hypothetical protein
MVGATAQELRQQLLKNCEHWWFVLLDLGGEGPRSASSTDACMRSMVRSAPGSFPDAVRARPSVYSCVLLLEARAPQSLQDPSSDALQTQASDGIHA